jgi:iron(III) transport system permease protein
MAPTLRHFDIVSAQMTSVKNSLISATIAGVCCSLMAVVLAYLTQRKSWPGHSIIDVLAIAPAAVPGIFFGIGYAATFNQHWFDRVARGAVITISMIFWTVPAGYQSAVAGLRQIDRSIDETATGLGAGSLRTLREILVPLLHAPLLTAFVTAFVRAITTLSVVLFLVTPSTPIATVTAFMLLDDSDLGGAAAMMVSVTALAVLVGAAVWTLAGRRLRLGEVANA